MTRQIRFNAFDMNCVGHQSPGLWAHPRDRSWQYKDLEYWTDLARTLERGMFDGIFIADVLASTTSIAAISNCRAIHQAAQIPVNDPLQLVPRRWRSPRNISASAITASTSFEHPYTFARRISTADHLTKGRVGWNIVTSYLESGAKNIGQGGQRRHDDRYEVADEYMEVVYKLWEGSWEEGAVVRDRDTAYLHPIQRRSMQIGHEGKFFEVPGVSSLRALAAAHAGALSGGRVRRRASAFAAQHAECVFVAAPIEAGPQVLCRRRSAPSGRRRPRSA